MKYLNIIGIVLLVIIIRKIDISETLGYLKNADFSYLIFGYPFLIFLIFTKSVRWNLLMRNQGVRYSNLETFAVYLWGFYFGAVTPSRIGEAAKVIYIQEKFKSFGEAFVSVFIDRLYDVAIRFILLFALYPFCTVFFEIKAFAVILVIVPAVAGIILLVKFKSVRNIFITASKYLIPKKFYDPIKSNFADFMDNIMLFVKNRKLLFITSTLSIVSFLCYSMISFMILKSYNINISYLHNLFFLVIAGLATILPISISGLGVREAFMIYLFSVIGESTEAAVLFSLSIYSISIILGLHGAVINIYMMTKKDKKIHV